MSDESCEQEQIGKGVPCLEAMNMQGNEHENKNLKRRKEREKENKTKRFWDLMLFKPTTLKSRWRLLLTLGYKYPSFVILSHLASVPLVFHYIFFVALLTFHYKFFDFQNCYVTEVKLRIKII